MRFPLSLMFHVFQSTLPVGGATSADLAKRYGMDHFNPRSPWGERPNHVTVLGKALDISIHAPRGGSDLHGHRR